ncbi:PH domain-containing protein [Corynebacterium breve]|uniref:PH domain-containing protein n=1 Tax=Corynebacterium breve TaxID=3049799 RepID=A0ABY8VHX3_9CORY|nr:PH domain-containing protein [Corynebacterium breve]WIM68677.1 PH domain-containing protein [Corynebacterium breve]
MSSEAEQPDATYFRPEKTHVVATVMMMFIAMIGISWAPLRLGWILILPILFIVWVYKASTRVDDEGIAISYLFRKNVSIPWSDFNGVAFTGSRASAVDKDDNKYMLPGVTFNSLPKLEAASKGRIPDALTAGIEAADSKVEVHHKDGHQVLMTKEEFAQHEHKETKE